jgi:hypothetical protein
MHLAWHKVSTGVITIFIAGVIDGNPKSTLFTVQLIVVVLIVEAATVDVTESLTHDVVLPSAFVFTIKIFPSDAPAAINELPLSWLTF